MQFVQFWYFGRFMAETAKNYKVHLIYISLAVVTFIAFEPILHNSFISFDDDEYIYNNPAVYTGLKFENAIGAFTNVHSNNYHPLTTISHMIDSQIFKLWPGGHHLTNLLLHIANTALLFYILSRITKKVWPAAFAAALFALHPMHVESVAWASERKDVLSTLFWLLTILAYSYYIQRHTKGKYAITLAFFVLGLLSKPMLVTLPFVLLLLDYWPFERFGKIKSSKIIAEKIPFFVLTAVSSIITLAVQRSMGLVKSLSHYPLSWRIENAIFSYVIYIKKMFLPTNLAIFYPHPKGTVETWQIVGAVFVLLFITVIALLEIRKKPYIAVGWFWFLGTLVPVIGIFQVGLQAYADRYTYIPYIGLFILITLWICDISTKLPKQKLILSITAGLILFSLGVKTYVQTMYWNNNLLLYSHAINVTKNNWWAYNFLGKALASQGEYAEAVEHFKKSLEIYPDNASVYYELAKTYLEKGDVNEAEIMYQRLLPPLPKDLNAPRGVDTSRYDYPMISAIYVNANINLARILVQKGDLIEAERRFKEALRIAPNAKAAQEGLEQIKKMKNNKIQKGHPDAV
ncbi:MAG: hypothetical protein A2Y10_08100 [Planctomycetes bacterium GWF2_41_51]|nr:MAG: hypothetical protein A2Y10_08100 [Planctomycetes bacterium GWF2_41_51]HBG26229.1 hypothetical protein [Phycisphaerales bacterium]